MLAIFAVVGRERKEMIIPQNCKVPFIEHYISYKETKLANQTLLPNPKKITIIKFMVEN